MKYVRVSQILARLKDYSHIDPVKLKNKCEIGEDVHKAIDANAKRDWYPLEEDRRLAYYHSYALWYKKTAPGFLLNETRYYDDFLRITGQIDAICWIPPIGHMLVDFK